MHIHMLSIAATQHRSIASVCGLVPIRGYARRPMEYYGFVVSYLGPGAVACAGPGVVARLALEWSLDIFEFVLT